MAAGDVMAGTFVKTPSHEVIEVLARSGLDFLCLDAEHAPFDRARLDACLAVARALDLPTLVRPEATQPHAILQALDMGADLSVGYGYDHQTSDEVMSALASVGRAAQDAGKAYMTFVHNAAKAAEWRVHGVSMFFVASEHTWMLQGAKAVVDGVKSIQ